MTQTLTIRELKTAVKALGFGLSLTLEFQVKIAGRPDATYFTTDRADAYGTAVMMARDVVGTPIGTAQVSCGHCGSMHPIDQSCICFDNGCE